MSTLKQRKMLLLFNHSLLCCKHNDEAKYNTFAKSLHLHTGIMLIIFKSSVINEVSKEQFASLQPEALSATWQIYSLYMLQCHTNQ